MKAMRRIKTAAYSSSVDKLPIILKLNLTWRRKLDSCLRDSYWASVTQNAEVYVNKKEEISWFLWCHDGM